MEANYVSIMDLHDERKYQLFLSNLNQQLYPIKLLEDSPFKMLECIIYYYVYAHHDFSENVLKSKVPENLRRTMLVDMNVKDYLYALKNTKIKIHYNQEKDIYTYIFFFYNKDYGVEFSLNEIDYREEYREAMRFLGVKNSDERFLKLVRNGDKSMLSLLPPEMYNTYKSSKLMCDRCERLLKTDNKDTTTLEMLFRDWKIHIYDERGEKINLEVFCKYVIFPEYCDEKPDEEKFDTRRQSRLTFEENPYVEEPDNRPPLTKARSKSKYEDYMNDANEIVKEWGSFFEEEMKDENKKQILSDAKYWIGEYESGFGNEQAFFKLENLQNQYDQVNNYIRYLANLNIIKRGEREREKLKEQQ